MSPNINSSKKTFSTNQISSYSDNNFSNDLNQSNYENNQSVPIKITITKHLCEPCPIFYTDIFCKVLIECKDPSHKNISLHSEIYINDKVDSRTVRNEDQVLVLSNRCGEGSGINHLSSNFGNTLDEQRFHGCNCNRSFYQVKFETAAYKIKKEEQIDEEQ